MAEQRAQPDAAKSAAPVSSFVMFHMKMRSFYENPSGNHFGYVDATRAGIGIVNLAMKVSESHHETYHIDSANLYEQSNQSRFLRRVPLSATSD